MLRQVLVQTSKEVFAADVSDQLTQDRGALRVGDSIEVHFDVGEIADFSGDRVSGRKLILVHTPVLAEHESSPAFGVFGGLCKSQVAHELSEGLVEPQVIPPLHGDQVTEPHVSELVENRIRASFEVSGRGTSAENVLIAESDAASVFHCSRVVLGNENLIVGLEGVRNPVSVLEESESRTRDIQDSIGIQRIKQ